MVNVSPLAFAAFTMITSVAAHKDKQPPAQSPPPVYPSQALGNPLLALAFAENGNPGAFDTAYKLPQGSVEACLDSFYHGDDKIQFDVGSNFVVVNNAPGVCTTLVREANDLHESQGVTQERFAELVGENSIRLNSCSAEDVEFLAALETTHFDVRVL
ncbi:hypothetical protein BKA67DRAFT_547294 [Truncatella angustata]|uniref:Uncharacterized protein n=1 Tax=Truncatella angustata TaxID=152316 RepID=A0A9P9A4U0_9PEZI|nr:uncharacterized protein BKA67DRAFT_547294 [Truncatella angustata]KAH6660214.1 hypothetical protein BKA67DRAFT_547294 [Truncatella angustata]KAH8199920.1 hypothetical protein TruAng_005916 [Truncatella angustata]